MDDPEQDQINNALRKVLWIIVAVAIVIVATLLYMPSVKPITHPPEVSIARDGDHINILYLGGIDNGFVGDFRITVNNVTSDYKKPKVLEMVAEIIEPNYACVNVEAIDLAVHTYRPIGYKCL